MTIRHLVRALAAALAGLTLVACASNPATQRPAAAPTHAVTPTVPPTRTGTPTPTGPPTSVATPTPTPNAPLTTIPHTGKLRVELWGDSISAQAAPYFISQLADSGKAIGRARTYPGTALCDWIPDIKAELNASDPSAFHPQAAVIQFSGDAFTPCMRDANGLAFSGQAAIDKYARDSAAVIGLFAKAGIPVYFASTPMSRAESARGYVGNTPIGKMFATLPARFPAGTARFIDAAAAVLWRGRFSATLPCQPGETCTGSWPDGTPTVVVRQADGGHFCPVQEVPGDGGLTKCPVYMPGAARFMRAITSRLLRDA